MMKFKFTYKIEGVTITAGSNSENSFYLLLRGALGYNLEERMLV